MQETRFRGKWKYVRVTKRNLAQQKSLWWVGRDFSVFSGGIERDDLHEMDYFNETPWVFQTIFKFPYL